MILIVNWFEIQLICKLCEIQMIRLSTVSRDSSDLVVNGSVIQMILVVN